MKGNKQYRFIENPEEKLFYDKFIEQFNRDSMAHRTLSMIVIGIDDNNSTQPKRILTEEEETICVNLIQWLGSPVGQGFLRDCGYVKVSNTEEVKEPKKSKFQQRIEDALKKSRYV